MGGDGRDEILRPRAGGLDVLCADFKDIFEIDGDVCEFALEEEDYVLVVLAFLVSLWVLCAGEGL